MLAALALVAATLAPQDTARPSGPQAADTYLDQDAATLVAGARARRERAERLVVRYQATVTQRIGLGIRALRRDRMLFGQELAAHIEWRRDGPSRVEVVGARQRVPIAVGGDQLPEDIEGDVEWLVIDPSADYLRIFGDDAEGFIHPLSDGAESHYRFASGDTTRLSMPDGREIRLLELRVIPREAEFRLISGSLWFDADTYGMVRAVFAPARPFDVDLDLDPEDSEEIPGWVKPIRAEIRFVTIEYGLYSYRWWMPRFFALDAEAQASVLQVPVRFERVYSGYRVEGGAEPVPGARRPAGSARSRDRSDSASAAADSLERAIDLCVRARRVAARAEAGSRAEGARIGARTGEERFYRDCREELSPDDRWPIEVALPADTQSLLVSPELGEPILQMGDVISESELRQLGNEIGAIPGRGWQMPRALMPSGVVGSLIRNARYNRVEALSTGLGGELDFGRLRADGSFRLGLADLVPNGELGVATHGSSLGLRLGGYRRLAVANPDARPLGALNSFMALLAQRDDGEYFRTMGAELSAGPANGSAWELRLYGEQQRVAGVETQASLPHLVNRVNRFRPNIVADRANQAGLSVALRGARVVGPAATIGFDLSGGGETGTYDFARGALSVRATGAAGPLAFGLELAGGTSSGALPVQSRFYLGGPATLRGYPGGAVSGDAFWRWRAEAGSRMPAVRVVLFADGGWAGERGDFDTGRSLISAGVGGALLDGLIRVDLARAVRPPLGWRFDVYLDGLF